LFWHFDPVEFARLHHAEVAYRRTWLERKIADCQQKLSEGVLSPTVRTCVLEDMVMFEGVLKAMYGEEVAGG
jgi:hypothetical protein